MLTIILTALVATVFAQQSAKVRFAESLLVDVRTPKEFAQGSVPGAVNIPLGMVKDRLNEFKNKKQVVVFCHSGIRAMFAKGILNRYGIKPVVNGGNVPRVNRKLQKQSIS
jgi:rhodanese-related sulfurtransferase